MTFEIRLGELWGSAGRDRPLAELTLDEHIHGELALVFDGRSVPMLGYFGPNDVCIGDWFRELQLAVASLASDGGIHVYDEGEQSQPAFRFARHGDEVALSIVDSEISDGSAIPDWQDVRCGHAEFIAQLDAALAELRSRLDAACPQVGSEWLKQHALPDGQ